MLSDKDMEIIDDNIYIGCIILFYAIANWAICAGGEVVGLEHPVLV